MNPNIKLEQSTEIKCEKCGCIYFKEVHQFRKLSKILTGEPQDSLIPIPVMRCDDCGHVNEEFKPKIKTNNINLK